MSLAAFLTTVVRVLDDDGVPFMLTGSLAAAFYGTPRATQGVDLVVDPERAQVDPMLGLQSS